MRGWEGCTTVSGEEKSGEEKTGEVSKNEQAHTPVEELASPAVAKDEQQWFQAFAQCGQQFHEDSPA